MPGMIVLPLRSTTWAPGGVFTDFALPTAVIRPSAMTRMEAGMGFPPRPSIKVAPFNTMGLVASLFCACTGALQKIRHDMAMATAEAAALMVFSLYILCDRSG